MLAGTLCSTTHSGNTGPDWPELENSVRGKKVDQVENLEQVFAHYVLLPCLMPVFSYAIITKNILFLGWAKVGLRSHAWNTNGRHLPRQTRTFSGRRGSWGSPRHEPGRHPKLRTPMEGSQRFRSPHGSGQIKSKHSSIPTFSQSGK